MFANTTIILVNLLKPHQLFTLCWEFPEVFLGVAMFNFYNYAKKSVLSLISQMLNLRLGADRPVATSSSNWQRQESDPVGSGLTPEPRACSPTTQLPVLALSRQIGARDTIDLSGIDHRASRGGVCQKGGLFSPFVTYRCPLLFQTSCRLSLRSPQAAGTWTPLRGNRCPALRNVHTILPEATLNNRHGQTGGSGG